MRRRLRAAGARLLALLIFIGVAAPASQRQIRQGEYLTQHVAMCVQCHTPRRSDGQLDMTRLFQGAPVPVPSPAFPNQQWAVNAPNIAGLTGFSDEDEIALLTTGQRLSGRSPSPPMPPFRLRREDAEAIVAYLRSIAASH